MDSRRSGGSVDYEKRYDRLLGEKFDEDCRVKPNTDLFRSYDDYVQAMSYGTESAPVTEAITLADVALKTRGQIGIVLGSAISDLYAETVDATALDGHSDLDVMILGRHNRKNPAPGEWGIDWWVQPDRRMPTNGRVDMWYAIGMNPEVKVKKKQEYFENDFATVERNLAYCNVEKPAVEKRINGFRKSIQKEANGVLLEAGLYLPHPRTVDVIVDHCTNRRRYMEDHFAAQAPAILMDYRYQAVRSPSYEIIYAADKRIQDLFREWGFFRSQYGMRTVDEYISVVGNHGNISNLCSIMHQYFEQKLAFLRRIINNGLSDFEYLRLSQRDVNCAHLPVMDPDLINVQGL